MSVHCIGGEHTALISLLMLREERPARNGARDRDVLERWVRNQISYCDRRGRAANPTRRVIKRQVTRVKLNIYTYVSAQLIPMD
eukprot:COSAG05_NODE_2861_length_2561_cov_1.502031_2_plen_84_part_00